MRAGRGSWLWKCRVSSCVLSPFEQHWHGSRIVVQSPCIDFGLVVLVEIGTSVDLGGRRIIRSEEHTSELQSRPHLVCRLLLANKNHKRIVTRHGSESTHYI